MSKYTNKILELYASKKLSGLTKKNFHDWLIDNELSEEKDAALFDLWIQPNEINIEQTEVSLDLLQTKLQPIITKSSNKLMFWRYAVAIIFLISLSAAYIFTHKTTLSEINFVEHFSPIGKVNTLTLPDGSVVQTNSSTILVYPESFGEDTRTLYLTGEANFKVVKNDKIPFIVKSKEIAVIVLGTEFNVTAYPDDLIFRVTLISGSIEVKDLDSEIKDILNPNEQFTYNKETKGHSISIVDIDQATAWQRGELIFRGATMNEITKILERKYGVTFHFKPTEENDDKYNFRFKKDASFAELIDVIKNVADDFNYKIVDDICYIY